MSVANEADFYRPCLILAHADGDAAPDACRRLRRLGWDVYRARSGGEVRRLAWMMQPELIVLAIDLAAESGWLTCAKLRREQPQTHIVLLGPDTPRNRELADFVGARALVQSPEGLAPTHPALALPQAKAG